MGNTTTRSVTNLNKALEGHADLQALSIDQLLFKHRMVPKGRRIGRTAVTNILRGTRSMLESNDRLRGPEESACPRGPWFRLVTYALCVSHGESPSSACQYRAPTHRVRKGAGENVAKGPLLCCCSLLLCIGASSVQLNDKQPAAGISHSIAARWAAQTRGARSVESWQRSRAGGGPLRMFCDHGVAASGQLREPAQISSLARFSRAQAKKFPQRQCRAGSGQGPSTSSALRDWPEHLAKFPLGEGDQPFQGWRKKRMRSKAAGFKICEHGRGAR